MESSELACCLVLVSYLCNSPILSVIAGGEGQKERGGKQKEQVGRELPVLDASETQSWHELYFAFLGFSLDSGKGITSKDDITFVSGAPRANHSGAVVLLKRDMKSAHLLPEHIFEGEGLASSFGYDVAVVDLNKDGWEHVRSFLVCKEFMASSASVGLEKSHPFRFIDSKNIFADKFSASFHAFITCILAVDKYPSLPFPGCRIITSFPIFSFYSCLGSGSVRIKIWGEKLTLKRTPTWFFSLVS